MDHNENYSLLSKKGEMGLVYKAYLTTREGTEIVAIKVNKGELAEQQ